MKKEPVGLALVYRAVKEDPAGFALNVHDCKVELGLRQLSSSKHKEL